MKEESLRKLPPGGEGPLYSQLSDLILAEIEQGKLTPDKNLPTVRELADELKISNGTVKHAYDVLERKGVIEKVRGRGTFVRSRGNGETHGKKERAMRAVDDMLDELRSLGFSPQETRIFFDLKMREREAAPGSARVIVADCNPEALSVISVQIAQIQGAEVECRLLDDLSYVRGLMEEDPDLIVTTTNHYEMVVQAAREDRVCRVVLSPSRGTIAQLAKAGSAGKVGIMTASERFAWIIRAIFAELKAGAADGAGGSDVPRMLFGRSGDAEEFLRKLDTVILPEQYSSFCTPQELVALRAFQEAGGVVIEFTYHVDAGSLMYLEQRIADVLAENKKRGELSFERKLYA